MLKPYSHSFKAVFMVFFMFVLGSFNNVLHATNETGSENPAQLNVCVNTIITIKNNVIVSENFKNQNVKFSNNSQTLDNTLYIVRGTTYYIDSSNNHLQLIEINNIQNNVAINKTTQNISLTNNTTSIAKPNANTSFIKLPFGKNGSNYNSRKCAKCTVPTLQNQIKTHKKASLKTAHFNLSLLPTSKTKATYHNNTLNANTAFCRYSFSLPPPFLS